jgi:hypothetical protein
MSVADASALETTLERLRQRYALYFHMPEGSSAGQERSIEVDLTDSARRRYPTAEIKYRRVYLAPTGASGSEAGPTMVTHAPAHVPVSTEPDSDYTARKHRVAVDEPTGPRVNMGNSADPAATPTPKVADEAPAANPDPPVAARPGWRRATDPEPPPAGPIKPQQQN